MIRSSALGAWARRHPDLAELVIGMAVVGAVLAVSILQWGFTDTGIARGAIFGLPLALAVVWSYRRRLARAERLARDLANQRLELARELHDAVAGQVAIIGIQAAAARRVLATEPNEASLALERIEVASRTAVGDLRRMLTALREGTEPVRSTALPGLTQLGPLVDEARAAGLDVTSTVSGSRPQDLPTALDHAAYRIVGEALTNVLKHAGPVRTDVTVAYRDDAVELHVENAAGRSTGGAGTGLGIVGMRERARMFGGDVVAGPASAGAWVVEAWLPTGAAVREPGPSVSGSPHACRPGRRSGDGPFRDRHDPSVRVGSRGRRRSCDRSRGGRDRPAAPTGRGPHGRPDAGDGWPRGDPTPACPVTSQRAATSW